MNPRRRLWWKTKARQANSGVVAAVSTVTEDQTLVDGIVETKKDIVAETPITHATTSTTTTKKTTPVKKAKKVVKTSKKTKTSK